MSRGAALALLLALPCLAGGRAHYGGTLKVAAVTRSSEADPLLADSPEEATLSALTSSPPCRLGTLERAGQDLRFTPVGLSAEDAARALERSRTSATPYRALLRAVRRLTVAEGAVVFHLDGPAPDLEQTLCHPALGLGVGPFRAAAGQLAANPTHPEGRPFVDALAVTRVDARTAERLLSQARTHVVLGAAVPDDAPQLFATYLGLSPKLPPQLKQWLEASVDRTDLARFFVRAPSGPMPGLLPPSLGGPAGQPARPARPPPLAPEREVTLLYDAALDDHRAIAERLQVKLQPAGFRVALKGVARRELRAKWAGGDFELVLHTVLLPPTAPGALALVLELAGQGSRAAALLQPMPSGGDPAARERAANDAAAALQAALPLMPLTVQGVGVAAAPEVVNLRRDALGLPRLDDAFLGGE